MAGTLDDRPTAAAHSGEGAARMLERIERTAREGGDHESLARACAGLREAVWQLAEDGHLALSEARHISRNLDAVLGRALDASQEPARALAALDRAANEGLDAMARLALEGSSSADTAVLFLFRGGKLEPRVQEGLTWAAAKQAGAPGTIAAETAARRETVHLRTAVHHPLAVAEGLDGTRALFAAPLMHGDRVAGVLRVGSRSAYEFSAHELRLFRGLASRSTALLGANAAVATQEARARRALRTFEALVDAAPVAIGAMDMKGLVRIWNRASEQLFGWTRAEVIGKPNPAINAEARGDAEAILEEVRRGHVVRDRLIRRARKDGAMVDLTLSAAPLHDEHGAITGNISIMLDVSERLRADAAAEQTARFREHLLGVVGHDLRNPLNAIASSAQILLRYSTLDERQTRVVERIVASAERMTRMIEDLLDFTRTRLGGAFPIASRRMDLREVCEQCIEELSLASPHRHVSLTAEGDLWGDWDADRIAQVVSNLVGNALQHSPESDSVRVVLRDDGDHVVLETHNGGPPIPLTVLPHVFEPGHRGEGVKTKGLGLGLYIVQQIVLAHGGAIEARSNTEEGTVFTVRLPRRARG